LEQRQRGTEALKKWIGNSFQRKEEYIKMKTTVTTTTTITTTGKKPKPKPKHDLPDVRIDNEFFDMLWFCESNEWRTNELLLALNYGNGDEEGRHSKTTAFEWRAYTNIADETHEDCVRDCIELWSILDEERRRLFFQLKEEYEIA
jgi:hypothetical protein